MDTQTTAKATGQKTQKPKGIRIQGLIGKKIIRDWLENYESMVAQDRPIDAVPCNSGKKSYDGVSDTAINRIMLEAAINDLPPVLKVCVEYRWINCTALGETLRRTGIAKSTYYRRCDKAVDFIYYHVNGLAAQIKDLLEKINKI